jgi:hypothetical protein
MRKLWDSSAETASRGKVPINWTISPSLADIAPGMMNYYYSLASEKECFVAGPSGMGYLMPINTNREDGIKLADFLTNKTYMDAYTKLTDRYMRMTGLRALTIWDDANADLRDSYEQNCRYLYGATVQNFGAGKVSSGISNNRLLFIKHETHYEGQYNTILSDMTRKVNAWNGEAPLFLSYQVKVWDCGTPQIVKLYEELSKKFGEKIEFVRADHFFALYNEANKMPFNLCMNEKTSVNSDSNGEIQFDFNSVYKITRYSARQQSVDFTLQLSENGIDWVTAENIIDKDFENSVNARYAKIIFNGSSSNIPANEIEIYGCVSE